MLLCKYQPQDVPVTQQPAQCFLYLKSLASSMRFQIDCDSGSDQAIVLYPQLEYVIWYKTHPSRLSTPVQHHRTRREPEKETKSQGNEDQLCACPATTLVWTGTGPRWAAVAIHIPTSTFKYPSLTHTHTGHTNCSLQIGCHCQRTSAGSLRTLLQPIPLPLPLLLPHPPQPHQEEWPAPL